jgi:hypothetical protein
VKRIAAGLRLPEPYAIPGAETPIPEDALPEQGSGVGTMTPIPERPMAYPVLHVMGYEGGAETAPLLRIATRCRGNVTGVTRPCAMRPVYEAASRRALTTTPKVNTVAANMKTARETERGTPDS